MSKSLRSRIDGLECKQLEAEWSQVLDGFPQLSEYELGCALEFWRECCGVSPAAMNPRTLDRAPGDRLGLLEVVRVMVPDIPAFALRFVLQISVVGYSVTADERVLISAGQFPARLKVLFDSARSEYEQAGKALGVL